MRALVTGATGLLGNNLVKLLVRSGWHVTCLYRSTSNTNILDGTDVQWLPWDRDITSQFCGIISNMDAVFHCAAQVGTTNRPTSTMISSNANLTDAIVEAFERVGSAAGCRLIYCSTVATCAISENGVLVTEETPWNLDRFGVANGYARTKVAAENRVLSAANNGIHAVVVNPCFMLGPGDCKLSSNRLILDVYYGKIPAYPPGYNNYVDVRDVARGIMAAAEKGVSGERYILGGENFSYREIFDKISTITGARAITKPLSKPLAKAIAWFGDAKEWLTGRNSLLNSTGVAWSFSDCIYSSAKAEQQLGYSHNPIEPAIEDGFRWFSDNGYLK